MVLVFHENAALRGIDFGVGKAKHALDWRRRLCAASGLSLPMIAAVGKVLYYFSVILSSVAILSV